MDPVKSAIIVIDRNLRVVGRPDLGNKNVVVMTLESGRRRIGVISVYLEGDRDISPYLTTLQGAIDGVGTGEILIAGDLNAASPWWGCEAEDARGAQVLDFCAQNELEIVNTGRVPTFYTVRGGRECTSIVDITVCSGSLWTKVRNWRVVTEGAGLSDHRPVKFDIEIEPAGELLSPSGTRIYNTAKADWAAFRASLRESLSAGEGLCRLAEGLESPEELESAVSSYTAAILRACEASIPKIGPRRAAGVAWWNNGLTRLRNRAATLRRRIAGANPRRKQLVVDDYLKARTEYKEAIEAAITASWKQFCTKQDRDTVWSGAYRILSKCAAGGGGVEARLRSPAGGGTPLDEEQSAELLAQTFYPDDNPEEDTPSQSERRERVGRLVRELRMVGDETGEERPLPFTREVLLG
ncbi:uncharacterized protein [Choristoneura fumiferana]|uniref:uncharacterized protein n=1 Tax=Choristoneura fumiferana TaxID=7141 RepID=UPI003D155690